MNRLSFRPSRRSLALAAGTLAALIGLGSVAHARPWGHRPHGGFFAGKMMRVLHDLDLTEQQELEAVRMRRALREEARDMRQAMKANMSALGDELEKETPDRAQAHALVDDAVERFRKLAHANVDRFLDFHAKLDAKQKAEIAERVEKAQARRKRRDD